MCIVDGYHVSVCVDIVGTCAQVCAHPCFQLRYSSAMFPSVFDLHCLCCSWMRIRRQVEEKAKDSLKIMKRILFGVAEDKQTVGQVTVETQETGGQTETEG